MPKFEISFYGRKVGAIGKFEKFQVTVEADNEARAISALYGDYEHISEPETVEV